MATATDTAVPTIRNERRQRSLWRDAWGRLIGTPAGRLGLLISTLLILLALFINVILPYNPVGDRNVRARLQPPSMLMDQATLDRLDLARWSAPFGFDELGRNLFVRVLHGAPI